MLFSLTLLCISEDLSHKIILYQSTVCAYAFLILLFSKISFLTDIVKSRESRLAGWLGGGWWGIYYFRLFKNCWPECPPKYTKWHLSVSRLTRLPILVCWRFFFVCLLFAFVLCSWEMKLNGHPLLMAIVAQRLSNISHRQQAFALKGMKI